MLAAVADFDAAGDGETLHGAASTASWLRGAVGLAPGDASERVRLARRSRDALEAPVRHLRSGGITYDHLRSIDRAVRFIPEGRQAEAVALLTDLAVAASVADVRTAGKHLRLVADPDGTLADCERQFERRHLTLAPLLDGMTSIDGLLDAESAALLNAALEPFLVPTGPEDARSAAQRRADGLTDIVRTACDHRLLPMVGGERPHLQVLVASGPGESTDGDLPRPPPARSRMAGTVPGRRSPASPGERGTHRLRRADPARAARRRRSSHGVGAHPATLLLAPTTTAGAPRWRLSLPQLHTPSSSHRRPPRASLVGGRRNRRRQRGSPLPVPPPSGA